MDTTRPSLLLRVRNRDDQAAWVEFDGIYRPMLNRFALARGLSAAEAEEIAQQCMTTIQQHIGRFEYDPTRGRFKSWLRTMVNNRIRNLLRDRREVQAATGEFARLEDEAESPDELFDKLWRREHIRHCLRLIKREVEAPTFNAFVAYVMEGHSIERVCADFDMSANHLRVIKTRMTKRIKRRMIELLGEEA